MQVFEIGLTLGGTVKGDPVKEIIKTAFDAGINMWGRRQASHRHNSPSCLAGLTLQKRMLRGSPRLKCASRCF
jgi:hypothetical protein